jgi:Co/Zn/Cd efflux system component
VLSLVAVTIYMTYDGISLLKNPPSKDTVNVDYLYSFAAVNLLVDLVCSGLFWLKGDDAFHEDKVDIPKLSIDTSIADDWEEEFGRLEEEEIVWTPNERRANQVINQTNQSCRQSCTQRCCSFFTFFIRGSQHHHKHEDNGCHIHKKSNLNMLSAFSHILGDTFRTISTFVAAMVSSITGIDGDICDAWAAIIVSITIVLLCLLLLSEIKDAAMEIWEEDCKDNLPITSKNYTIKVPASNSNSSKSSSSTSVRNQIYQRVPEEADDSAPIVI